MDAILFDLDNTLYPEIDFVKSGFREVSRYIALRYNLKEEVILNKMINIMKRNGRGRIFDILLKELNIFSPEKVQLFIYIYRSHMPDIKLYEHTLRTLKELKNMSIKIGLVTDGMASVQRNKVITLGLEKYFDVIIYTDQLGKEFWKPSLIPFKIVLELLEVKPCKAGYVGDDISKDFYAPNSMGMLSIQVKRDITFNDKVVYNKLYKPKVSIDNIKEILSIID